MEEDIFESTYQRLKAGCKNGDEFRETVNKFVYGLSYKEPEVAEEIKKQLLNRQRKDFQ